MNIILPISLLLMVGIMIWFLPNLFNETEKQRFSKPYLGRYIWYRWWVGGVWRKYAYSFHPHGTNIDGWYCTQDNNDHCIKKTSLQKLKEVKY